MSTSRRLSSDQSSIDVPVSTPSLSPIRPSPAHNETTGSENYSIHALVKNINGTSHLNRLLSENPGTEKGETEDGALEIFLNIALMI